MPAEVSAKLQLTPEISHTPSSGIFPSAKITPAMICKLAYEATTPGDADKCDEEGVAELTFVASTPQELDLTTLAGIVPDYTTAGIARGRILCIRPMSDTPGATITFEPGATNGWTGPGSSWKFTMPADETDTNQAFFAVSMPGEGMGITSTSKTIKFTPSAHAFTVRVWIAGASA